MPAINVNANAHPVIEAQRLLVESMDRLLPGPTWTSLADKKISFTFAMLNPNESLNPITRRGFHKIASCGLIVISRTARAANFSMKQYHNQPVEAPLHKRLT